MNGILKRGKTLRERERERERENSTKYILL